MEGDFEDDICTLCSYFLIRTNTDATEFEMHRLVQFSTKSWLELRGETEKWKEKFIATMAEKFPVGQYENWTKCQKLFPHVEKALEYQPANQNYLQRWASILLNAAWYADEKGNYSIAEKMNRRAADAYEKALGPEHPGTVVSMSNLAVVLRGQGKYEAAEEMHRQALELWEKILGPEHLNTVISMNNLALVLDNQGKYEAAEEMHWQVLELRKKILGPEHPDTLTSMSNLAVVLDD